MKMKQFIITIVFLIMTVAFQAMAAPPFPHTFFGTVHKDSNPVPDGTSVSAWIGGAQYASTTTPAPSGGPGSYVMNVPGDDPDTPAREGGINGETVSFRIGSETAAQTSAFSINGLTNLNLTVVQSSSSLSLTVHISPSSAGYVSKNPDKNTYYSGEQVTLTAHAYSGSTFASWSGDISGTTSSVVIVMNGNKAVTANFNRLGSVDTYNLNTSIYPPNAGYITLNPYKAAYDPGDPVTINAVANSGYLFSYWGGDMAGSQNPVVVAMNANKMIEVYFTAETGETISTPNPPAGPAAGEPGVTYAFTVGGATSDKGHAIQYLFDWGDGTQSIWLPVGTTNASHAWSTPNTYSVKVQARCSTDVTAMSSWSQVKTIKIEQVDLPLIGMLENPVGGQKVSGVTILEGWALDKKGIKKIELFIDDQYVGNVAYGSTLPDVKDAHPGYSNAEHSGFCAVWNTSTYSPGSHRIKVRLHNLDGQTRDLEVSVTVLKFHEDFVESVTPPSRTLRMNRVTAGGIQKRYDIKIEWSNDSQSFVITEITPR